MPPGLAGKRANPIPSGAIVSGPDAYDNFADQTDNYKQMEPATYNNAPLLGILAQLSGGHGGYGRLLLVVVPAPKAAMAEPSPALVTASNELSTEQKPTVSWTANGRTYRRYLTVVTDKLDKTLKYVNLLISKLYGPLWAVTKSGDLYVFPSWIQSFYLQGRPSSLCTSTLRLKRTSPSQATLWHRKILQLHK
ncbi:endoglucanase 19 [Eucalyptus grandis]|uniref:endoglucanase 19 n=1 Tax=Eucalyptus grandis TaxID=71139 RepID=UPI00192E9DAF|nr:endoglucanase 19 [Eucalyptus grandis]XP_039167979.1 endoglucanase 19 [Eucalyptus grandis]XP_039167983.1 endoglucanase 19 [Eucalyptus grandis]